MWRKLYGLVICRRAGALSLCEKRPATRAGSITAGEEPGIWGGPVVRSDAAGRRPLRVKGGWRAWGGLLRPICHIYQLSAPLTHCEWKMTASRAFIEIVQVTENFGPASNRAAFFRPIRHCSSRAGFIGRADRRAAPQRLPDSVDAFAVTLRDTIQGRAFQHRAEDRRSHDWREGHPGLQRRLAAIWPSTSSVRRADLK
jgi:hypothetical protein